jgi:DNA polymerase V
MSSNFQIRYYKKSSNSLPQVSNETLGFESVLDQESPVDLNSLLIKNQEATFFMRVRGHAMKSMGIFDGDIAIVDRSIPQKDGDIVIAFMNETMIIRRLMEDQSRLESGDPNFPSIEIKDTDTVDFEICGVVVHTIHKLL